MQKNERYNLPIVFFSTMQFSCDVDGFFLGKYFSSDGDGTYDLFLGFLVSFVSF